MEKIKRIHAFLTGYNMYFFLLILIVVGLPLSKFSMSVGIIAIAVQWLIAENPLNKFKQFFKNRIALVTVSTFLIFLVGLAYTTDFEYGIKDIRVKLPLLTFPIVFSTSYKLKEHHFKWLIVIFISATFISTLYGYLVYKEILPAKKVITELRDISQFISHIRLSLMVVLSMFLLPIVVKEKWWIKTIGVFVFLWFAFFLSLIESATGFIIGSLTLFAVSIYIFITQRNKVAIIPALFMLIMSVGVGFKLIKTYQDIKMTPPPRGEILFTSKGNPYDKIIEIVYFDNGNYSDDYVCYKELRQAWGERSEKNFDDIAPTGSPYHFIILRYLCSKGYRKDYEGLYKLTDEDIHNIEKGIPNYLEASNDLMSRLYALMFEIDGYLRGANINGNSLAQRIEYWKTSKEIANENFLFGIGTGDIENAFEEKYKNNGSLKKEYQLRSHNQYLSTFIALGFIGVVLFILTLIIPLQYAIKKRNYFYFVFACITLLSFFSEDTLETQDGVFLFAFFNSLFLFLTPKKYLQ